MRWGVFYLPTSLPATPSEGAERFRSIIEQARYAEELGFDSAWLAEHHFQPFGGLFASPAVIGTAIARHTRAIRIGTGVALLPYHNPLRTAEDYATLDVLSNGRLEFGVGHGFVKWEGVNLGLAYEESRERFREHLEIILKAWTEPSFSHKGRFYEYQALSVWPRPLQAPHPPVWMAATATTESFEFSGRQGYQMMLIAFLHEVEDLRAKVEAYLSARERAGHDSGTTRVLALYHIYVGENPAEARASSAFGIMEYVNTAARSHQLTAKMEEPQTFRQHLAHRATLGALTPDDYLARRRVVVGSAIEVREQLSHLCERLSLTDVIGLFDLGGLTDAQVRASMRRFIEDVAPYVK